MQHDNEMLAVRSRALDEQTFSDAYDSHVDLIYRHIVYLLGNTQAEAQSVTEQVFLRFWATSGRRPLKRPNLSSLLEIAHNLTARHIESHRSNGHRPAAPVSSGTPPSSSRPSPALDAEDHLMPGAILRLSPFQRKVLLLQLVDGMDSCAIASGIGKSARSVRLAQYRALSNLHRLMAAEPNA